MLPQQTFSRGTWDEMFDALDGVERAAKLRKKAAAHLAVAAVDSPPGDGSGGEDADSGASHPSVFGSSTGSPLPGAGSGSAEESGCEAGDEVQDVECVAGVGGG